MSLRLLGVFVAFVAVGLAVVGCGTNRPGMSSAASVTVSADVASVRAKAAANDRAGSVAAVARLRADVATLGHDGQISKDQASRILAAASTVEADLALLPTTTTTPATTRPPAPGDGKKGGGGGGGGGGD